jgi:uncharacterized protein YbaR (Trm112 family)
MVSQELLAILRCPNCVREGPEAGLLDHVGNWLICADCQRKYPIRDDIPVMLVEEGERFREVPVEELPPVPPPEERRPPVAPQCPLMPDERKKLIAVLLGLAIGIGLFALLVAWLRERKDNQST